MTTTLERPQYSLEEPGGVINSPAFLQVQSELAIEHFSMAERMGQNLGETALAVFIDYHTAFAADQAEDATEIDLWEQIERSDDASSIELWTDDLVEGMDDSFEIEDDMTVFVQSELARVLSYEGAKEAFRRKPREIREDFMKALAYCDVDVLDHRSTVAADAYVLAFLHELEQEVIAGPSPVTFPNRLTASEKLALVAEEPWFDRVQQELQDTDRLDDRYTGVIDYSRGRETDAYEYEFPSKHEEYALRALNWVLNYRAGKNVWRTRSKKLSRAQQELDMYDDLTLKIIRQLPEENALTLVSEMLEQGYGEWRALMNLPTGERPVALADALQRFTVHKRHILTGEARSSMHSVIALYIATPEEDFWHAVDRTTERTKRVIRSTIQSRFFEARDIELKPDDAGRQTVTMIAHRDLTRALEDPELEIGEYVYETTEQLSAELTRFDEQADELVGVLPRRSRIYFEYFRAETEEEREKIIEDENTRREKDKYGPPINHTTIQAQYKKMTRQRLSDYEKNPLMPIRLTGLEFAAELRAAFNTIDDETIQNEIISEHIHTDQRRELFKLWVQGYSSKEIGEKTGRSVQSVGSMVRKTLKNSGLRAAVLGDDWMIKYPVRKFQNSGVKKPQHETR